MLAALRQQDRIARVQPVQRTAGRAQMDRAAADEVELRAPGRMAEAQAERRADLDALVLHAHQPHAQQQLAGEVHRIGGGGCRGHGSDDRSRMAEQPS